MAALATTAVSLYPTDTNLSEGYPRGKGSRGVVQRSVKLTAVSVGGSTNTIGATALGFVKLLSCGNFLDTSNAKVIPAVVDPVNNVILLGAGSSLAVGDLSSVTGYISVVGTK